MGNERRKESRSYLAKWSGICLADTDDFRHSGFKINYGGCLKSAEARINNDFHLMREFARNVLNIKQGFGFAWQDEAARDNRLIEFGQKCINNWMRRNPHTNRFALGMLQQARHF